jgi:hypothetical protein
MEDAAIIFSRGTHGFHEADLRVARLTWQGGLGFFSGRFPVIGLSSLLYGLKFTRSVPV